MTNTASVRPTGYDAYLNLTTKLRITRDSQWEEHHHARTLAEIRRLIADPQ